MLACWSTKGGVGTTTVAAGIACALAARAGGSVLLVDLGGDLPCVFGQPDPVGPGLAGWLAAGPDVPADALGRIEEPLMGGISVVARGVGALSVERADALVAALNDDPRPIVIDLGVVRRGDGLRCQLLGASARSLLVTRACPVALRGLGELPSTPSGVIVVRDHGRSIAWPSVAAAAHAQVVAELDVDPAVGRALDAGLARRSFPRGFLSVLGSVT